MTVHEQFYAAHNYIYEVFIVNQETLERTSIGVMDQDTFKKVMPEIQLYLKDHSGFYWTTMYYRTNEHTDDYLSRIDSLFTKRLSND